MSVFIFMYINLRFWGHCLNLVEYSKKAKEKLKSWNIIETYYYMRLRKAPYTEFRRVFTSLVDYVSGFFPFFSAQ